MWAVIETRDYCLFLLEESLVKLCYCVSPNYISDVTTWERDKILTKYFFRIKGDKIIINYLESCSGLLFSPYKDTVGDSNGRNVSLFLGRKSFLKIKLKLDTITAYRSRTMEAFDVITLQYCPN